MWTSSHPEDRDLNESDYDSRLSENGVTRLSTSGCICWSRSWVSFNYESTLLNDWDLNYWGISCFMYNCYKMNSATLHQAKVSTSWGWTIIYWLQLQPQQILTAMLASSFRAGTPISRWRLLLGCRKGRCSKFKENWEHRVKIFWICCEFRRRKWLFAISPRTHRLVTLEILEKNVLWYSGPK